MKNIIFLVVILMVGCNSILANNWKIKENSDLTHMGVDVIYLENDNARIMLADQNGKLPSNILFIAGPSRTADIELITVFGVHGSQKAHLILY